VSASRWRTASIVLTVGLVICLAGLVHELSTDGTSSQADHALVVSRAESGAEKAARVAAVHLTTYDYRSLDTAFSWVDDAGTAKFRKEYAKVSAPIKKVVAQLKVHAVGSVDDAAAEAKDADHATVLLFVDQTLTSGTSSERKLVTPRVTMTMVRTGGHWLVDEVAVRNLAGG
jgi:Mce-associated membrane protein